MRTTIETLGGRYFDLANPTPDQVNLDDVSIALANQSRFNGFVTRPYSVAEHAILVMRLVRRERPDLALAALHHDSHEAYIGDLTTPLKAAIEAEAPGAVGKVVRRLDGAIATAFRFDMRLFDDPAIKAADELALRIEARALKPSRGVGEHWGYDEPVDCPISWSPGIDPWSAAYLFRALHQELVVRYGWRRAGF